MPNILFASNNLVHWPLSISSSESVTFDSSRVPYSLQLNYNEVMSSPVFTPAAGNITWIHNRMYMDALYTTSTFQMMRAFDDTGQILFSIDKKSGSGEYITILKLYRPSGSLTIEQTFPFNGFKMNSVDVRYENSGSELNMGLYVNGGLAGYLSWTGAAGWGQPAYFTLGAVFAAQNTGSMHVTEMIVADGDTRNARLNLLRPTAVGGETDWVGIATDLADNDPTSGMTSIAAAERQTLTLSAYTGAGNISSLVVATMALAGANAPQNFRHTVRMGATNYDSSADIPLGQDLRYGLTDFQINPATSLPWVSGDLGSLEMGFISKA